MVKLKHRGLLMATKVLILKQKKDLQKQKSMHHLSTNGTMNLCSKALESMQLTEALQKVTLLKGLGPTSKINSEKKWCMITPTMWKDTLIGWITQTSVTAAGLS